MTEKDMMELIDTFAAERGLAETTVERFQVALRGLANFCGGWDSILAITPMEIEQWARHKGQTCLLRTVVGYFTRNRSFFAFLVKRGMLERNPFDDAQPPGGMRQQTNDLHLAYARPESEIGVKAFDLLEEFCDSRNHAQDTRSHYREKLRMLLPIVGSAEELMFATAEDVGMFIECFTTPYGRRTAYFEMRAFFDYAVEHEAAPDNPFRRVDCPSKVPPDSRKGARKLSEGDLIRILECARLRADEGTEIALLDYALTCLVIYYGVRPSALYDANIGDYQKDMEGCYFVIRGPKAGMIQLNRETEDAFDRYLEYRRDARDDDPLFAVTMGPYRGERYSSKKTIVERLYRVMDIAHAYYTSTTVYNCLYELAIASGLSPEDTMGFYGLTKSDVILALGEESRTVRATTPEERLRLGITTRADIVRGLATRKDLEDALNSNPETELFDVNVSYDGTVRLAPLDPRRFTRHHKLARG